MAYLADGIGFDFWLDVIDMATSYPAQVKAIEARRGPLTAFELGVLQAAIVEVALINCTHVIALVTANAVGSQWIPYEYGRIVDRSRTGAPAAAWRDSTTIKMAELPEYLHLAPVHLTEKDIVKWLKDELAALPACPKRAPRWRGAKPKRLPTCSRAPRSL